MALPPPIHILYIGTEEPTAHLLLKTVDELGYSVSQTTDIGQAGLTYQQAGCDVILLDQIAADEGHFLETISALAAMPVIVILPAGQEARVPTALDHGADDYLIRD
ncbi:MAG: hypothetical protein KDF65_11735, partial [Anaerolineae bacterium]|nr:hypothetical protein [Anaerolineae bacterium]